MNKYIQRFLCIIGIHCWHFTDIFYPNGIVEHIEYCSYCQKEFVGDY